MRRVAGEGDGDGVARPPRHPFHAVEVLRAGGEDGDPSWGVREQETDDFKETVGMFSGNLLRRVSF